MKVTVIIPTYNERANLTEVVRAVVAHGYSVMVVDDQSPDGTGALADELAGRYSGQVDVLHRTGRRGYGRSYIDGIRRALATDADLICQMDADLSHSPDALPEMVAAARRFDVVIGSRYLHGISVVNWPLRRILLSTCANRYVRWITGLGPRDCTSGFRCWRRHVLARMPFDRIVSDGYALQVELLYEAARIGCLIGEVPIIFVERREGESKVSGRIIFESLLVPWRLVLRGRAGTGRASVPVMPPVTLRHSRFK